MIEIAGVPVAENLAETIDLLKGKLFAAVETGDFASAEAILKTGLNPNFELPSKASPINMATARSTLEILELLLRHGATPNFTTSGPVTTLGQACLSSRLDMIQPLLNWGARVDGYGAEARRTALMVAAEMGNKEIVQALLAAKADPNFVDSAGVNALAYAQKNARTEIIAILAPITAGAQTENGSKRVSEEDLLGQDLAKSALKQVIGLVRVNEERKKHSLPTFNVNLHAVFSGNSGTGKTTFARYYAERIKEIGFLKQGQLIEVSRANLVGEYIGGSTPKTTAAIEKARGGILFIDEAYTLKIDRNDVLGQECINALIKYMEDYRNELVVILAGYTDLMRAFLDLNPGLKSRVPNIIPFEDFTDAQIGTLLDEMCKKHEMVIDEEDRTFAIEQVLIKKRGKGFGNAREVRNVFERLVAQHCARIANHEMDGLHKDHFKQFIYSDITVDPFDEGGRELFPAIDPKRDPKTTTYKLHSLRGMHSIKQEIQSMTDFIRIRKIRMGATSAKSLQLHMLFTGNPGTGKTTVARLIGDIYREVGVLPSGHLVEVDRSDLIGGYLGQTGLKTRDRIEDARGGILFVDEAYSLFSNPNQPDMYANEAVDTILKYMEDYRDQLVVIFAGYPEPMDQLMRSNPGLRGRFSTNLVFTDFTDAELSAICIDICNHDGYELSDAAHGKLLGKVLDAKASDTEFANARTARNLIEQAFKNHARRVAQLDPRDLMNRATLNTLEEGDIP